MSLRKNYWNLLDQIYCSQDKSNRWNNILGYSDSTITKILLFRQNKSDFETNKPEADISTIELVLLRGESHINFYTHMS